ncbi:hypothetical protein BC943DRAFT_314714 [Umbelopsis sp. AD052]|nr:hypothetical protein BC943DRAFT_314714 [Umbelopsis sp. AD052]
MADPSQPSSIPSETSSVSSSQKKRSRATAEQLAILEDTFAVNVSPNSKLRAHLSARLNMTERSIQIWFQNRRAKVKHLQKKAEIQAQEDAIKTSAYYHRHSLTPGYYPRSTMAYHRPSLPPNMTFPRSYSAGMVATYPMRPNMAPHSYHSAGWPAGWQPDPTNPHGMSHYAAEHTASPGQSRTSTPIPMDGSQYRMAYMSEPPHEISLGLSNQSHSISLDPEYPDTTPAVNNPMMTIAPTGSTALPPSLALSGQPFTAFSLTIGTWHRMKLQQADLYCSFNLQERTFSWHISDCGHFFKAELPFDSISSIKYTVCDDAVSGLLVFDLRQAPMFFMDNDMATSADGLISWIQCSDFTENTQASQCLQHTIKGVSQNLRQELQTIITMDKTLENITHIMPSMTYLHQDIPTSSTMYQHPSATTSASSSSLSAPEYAWPGYSADSSHTFDNI